MKAIQVKRLHPKAIVPERATNGSAGYDLHACIENPIPIQPGETVRIPTGFAIAIEDSACVGLIYPRSGMSTKYNVSLPNAVGVIDSDYRGEILVALTNYSNRVFTVNPEQRVAQMVFTPIYLPKWEEVEALNDTQRGEGGFGSSGQ